MKIKLKVDKVISGAVWFAGSILRVPEDLSADEAKKLIDAQEAESIKTAAVKDIKE